MQPVVAQFNSYNGQICAKDVKVTYNNFQLSANYRSYVLQIIGQVK